MSQKVPPMKQTDSPDKLVLPFADAGAKNAIPAASQIGITAGAASLTDGFPPLTRTPISAGGVPPSGLDMNGILYELSAIARWLGAGAGFVYDGTFANDTDVGGYPKGARVLRTDGAGYWINTVDNNTTDPEAAGAVAAGWVPDYTSGATAITMTSANVTLTPLQYGKPIVLITGTLTTDLNLIFPSIPDQWVVVNGTSGAHIITAKTAAGTGVTCVQSGATYIYGDGTNIASLSAQSIPNASTTVAGIVELATSAETITGTDTVRAVTPAGLAAATAADSRRAKAWVNFNGTLSGTISPRAGYNVSSITKNGTGDYTVNFTSAMADANYAIQISFGSDGTSDYFTTNTAITAPTTTSFRIRSATVAPTGFDAVRCNVTIHGN